MIETKGLNWMHYIFAQQVALSMFNAAHQNLISRKTIFHVVLQDLSNLNIFSLPPVHNPFCINYSNGKHLFDDSWSGKSTDENFEDNNYV